MPENTDNKWDGTFLPQEFGQPPERLDDYIAAGISKGKAERARRRKAARRGLWTGMAAMVLLASCVLSIRVSPAFASMLKEIPGLEAFVKLIDRTSDRGIRLAVENEFYQAVDASDEHDGVKFDVEGIIVDEARMVMFYTLHSRSPVMMGRPDVMDISLQSLRAVVSWGNPAEEQEQKREPGLRRGTIDIQLQDGVNMPDEVVFKTEVLADEHTGSGKDARVAEEGLSNESSQTVIGSFTVHIPIDRSKFARMKEELALNRSIEAEGQKITFEKATISPLRIGVEIAYDTKNSKQIFDAADLRLVDGQGTVWRSFGGSHLDADHEMVYFESSYFRQPKELYLEGKLFRALDRDNRDIVIDTERKLLLQAPDGKVELEAVTDNGGSSTITLVLTGLAKDDHMGYSLLGRRFTDADGHVYSLGDVSGTSVSWDPDAGVQKSYYKLPKGSYKQPLTFHVENYPGYVRHPYRIQVK